MSNIGNYENLDDMELWEDLRNNDRDALNEIYRRYIDVLYAYGNRISNDHGLVEDSIQEVFITIWEKRQKIKKTTSVKFYLFKSLKRRIFRNLKSSKKFGFQYDFSESSLAAKLRTEPTTETLDEVTIKKIHQSLNQLTNRQKEIIYLRFYARLEYPEIAEVMGLTVKATYKLLARAIQRLKDNFRFTLIFL
ncbi:RNA polymerase sigma factor [Autumnicola musiva]|uniref:Sigma-70 family RNA polymerase sigma factor n=1 Tax=Autumnicola musiva TaxID=3075589 RepID=A0ABU3D9F1_9FLAO|nr:sigma-70 family RNA polymerase sigma factor [Zunongwangia sp. F117]MDT0677974.1 sigma-70 family RNA polymerase sigma factor [Zunongwangia sp. F117]